MNLLFVWVIRDQKLFLTLKNIMRGNSTCIITEDGKLETINYCKKPWKITLAQTGLKTQTAGRIKKINRFLEKDENFMLTYGDGLSNVDILRLLNRIPQ